MVVLVAVPDIANPFFAEVLQGIDDTLSAAGYGLIIANLAGSPEKEARYVDLVCAGKTDGVLLLCGHVMRSPDRDLRDARVPLVAACEYIPRENFPQVTIDNVVTAREAVRHLVELGHTSIAYLSGPAPNILEQQRFEGYRQALREAGIAADAGLILPGDFTFRTGVEAGLIKTLHAAGLQIPDDLSVAGFDGIAYADYCEPTLTTIVQPRRDIGATAAAELIALMTTGKAGQRKDIKLPATLMLRDSTRPPRKSPGHSSRGARSGQHGYNSARPSQNMRLITADRTSAYRRPPAFPPFAPPTGSSRSNARRQSLAVPGRRRLLRQGRPQAISKRLP